MEIRRARPSDLKDILDYMQERHPTSSMSDIPFDRRSSAKMISNVTMSREFYPLIARNSKRQVSGILIGALEPYFCNENKYYATDLFFISDGYGWPLLHKFKEWVWQTKADKIIMGVSSGDERAMKFLESQGMENTGGMYVLRR